MIRWKESEPARLHPQEQALLALCDRLTVLEQAFTAECEHHRLTRQRLDHVQKDLKAAEASSARLERQVRSMLDILEREE